MTGGGGDVVAACGGVVKRDVPDVDVRDELRDESRDEDVDASGTYLVRGGTPW